MSRKTSERGRRAGGGRLVWTPARIGVLTLAVLTLIFVFENTSSTEIRLLIPVVTMPLWAALLATGLIGALCGAYAAYLRRRRH
ncbi:LapA family protein [Streptomyces sp. A012304]|uniref:LapA family protein n=1 Tax=Streptomyces sp. A012304 TaxID=375446 RepID=UPI00223159CE|nr:LapA family protein [Streptomyces sp. A012304]